ncbi:hypothetical protein JCM12296A_01200 [Desulfosarcina cetonica]
MQNHILTGSERFDDPMGFLPRDDLSMDQTGYDGIKKLYFQFFNGRSDSVVVAKISCVDVVTFGKIGSQSIDVNGLAVLMMVLGVCEQHIDSRFRLTRQQKARPGEEICPRVVIIWEQLDGCAF